MSRAASLASAAISRSAEREVMTTSAPQARNSRAIAYPRPEPGERFVDNGERAGSRRHGRHAAPRPIAGSPADLPAALSRLIRIAERGLAFWREPTRPDPSQSY